jgi:hypothetical protein
MARPTSKDGLIEASETGLRLLLEEIDAAPGDPEATELVSESGDRSIRDVVCHLHEWHRLMLGWYESGMRGEKPAVPAEGYSWKTTPALNDMLRARHRGTPLAAALDELLESHRAIHGLIDFHTDEELFTKRYYPWTGSTSLGAYFVSSTSSHYDWARKKIRRFRKLLSEQGQLKSTSSGRRERYPDASA